MTHYILDRGREIADLRDRFQIVIQSSWPKAEAGIVVAMTPDQTEAFRLLEQVRRDAV